MGRKRHHSIGETDLAAKCHHACVNRLGTGQILFANARIDAIGGNDNIGFRAAAVFKMKRKPPIRQFFITDTTPVEVHCILQPGKQHMT